MYSDSADVREQVVEYSRRMAQQQLSPGTSGNVSARVDEHTMAITPTGVPYEQLTAADICLVGIETGDPVQQGLKPSSETPMHRAVYRLRNDIQAIVHTHSLYATAFAVAGRAIQAVHYVIATMGHEIPVVPYHTYGTPELAEAAAAGLKNGKAALLANHGVLALGQSLAEAYYHAETVEYLAQLSVLAETIGGARVLPVREIDRVIEKFRGYGQRPSSATDVGEER